MCVVYTRLSLAQCSLTVQNRGLKHHSLLYMDLMVVSACYSHRCWYPKNARLPLSPPGAPGQRTFYVLLKLPSTGARIYQYLPVWPVWCSVIMTHFSYSPISSSQQLSHTAYDYSIPETKSKIGFSEFLYLGVTNVTTAEPTGISGLEIHTFTFNTWYRDVLTILI